mmetsp:Transcript_8398/g.23275  ORF Transcript_8398/g.23275 Transcript_8398/m.23275 type:complete len:385 (-) Transcript_8398:1418-2572(-)
MNCICLPLTSAAVLLAAVSVLSLLTSIQASGSIGVEDDFVVAGYLPDYRFYIGDSLNEVVMKLTDLYLFSTDFDPDATDGMFSDDNPNVCCINEDHLKIAKDAKDYREKLYKAPQGQGLKLWLTVGGAGRSNGFPKLLSGGDESQREQRYMRVIQSLIQKCQEHGLSGIDFDNQFFQRQQDLSEYALFLEMAAVEFHASDLLISMSLRPGVSLSSAATNSVDRINLMAYDGPHASLDNFVTRAVDAAIEHDVPPSSIVLGFPAYARHEGNPNNVKTFSEIFDETQGGHSKIDLDKRNKWQGYVIDSPADIRQKVQYAIDRGLKGVYMWELGQDKQHQTLAPSGFLLEAAAHYVHTIPKNMIRMDQGAEADVAKEDDSSTTGDEL